MKERFWLKPTAIFLGIFAWLYVNIISESPITREVSIKIKYLNIDAQNAYRVVPEAPEVKLTVRGPRGVFIRTKIEENTFASVDLNNCHGGKLTLPVNVILPSYSNLELVSKEPAQLVVNMVPMASKLVPVVVKKIGKVPEGYLNDEPQTTPEEIMVTAPANLINTIRECGVDVDLKDVKSSISAYKHGYIVYTDGKTESRPDLNYIEISNNNIKLDMAVREGYPEKEVPVKPEIINKAPEGRKLDSFIALPEKVVITGPQRILDTVEAISLERIDLGMIQKSSTINVAAICPKGLKIIGNNTVALTVNYVDVVITKTLTDLPLEVTSGGNQLVEPVISTYSIELEGLIDDINAININEVKNIICVTGLPAGTHDIALEAPYGLSERVMVKSITPATIPITINILEKVDTTEQNLASDSTVIESKEQEVSVDSTTMTPADNAVIATASVIATDTVSDNIASITEKIASPTEVLLENK